MQTSGNSQQAALLGFPAILMATAATPKSPDGTFDFFGAAIGADEDSPVAGFQGSYLQKQSKDGSILDTMESSNHLNFSQKSARKELGLIERLESLGESVANEVEMNTNKTCKEPNPVATSLASISEQGSQCSDVEIHMDQNVRGGNGTESLQNLGESRHIPQSKTSISKLDHVWKIGHSEEQSNIFASTNAMLKMETHQSYLSTNMMEVPQSETPKARKVSGYNFDDAPSIEQFPFDGAVQQKYCSVEFPKRNLMGSGHLEHGSSRKCSVFENSIMEEDLCEEYSEGEDERELIRVAEPEMEDGIPGGSIAEFNDAETKTKLDQARNKANKASEISIGEEVEIPAGKPSRQIPGKISTIYKSSFEHLLNGTPKAQAKPRQNIKESSFDLSVGEFEVPDSKSPQKRPQPMEMADINKSLGDLMPNIPTKRIPVLLDIPIPVANLEWKVNTALRDFQGVDDDEVEQGEEHVHEMEDVVNLRPYQQHAVQKTTFDEMFKIGLSCSVISHSKIQKSTHLRANNTNGSIRFQAVKAKVGGGNRQKCTTRSWSPTSRPIQINTQAKLRAIAPGFRKAF